MMKKLLIVPLLAALLAGGVAAPEYAGAKMTGETSASDALPGVGFGKNLYFGLRNNPHVAELQEFLTDQGYYAGPVTGNFFLMTLQSVRTFQSANGIYATGYFGPKSRAAANEILKKIIGDICMSEEECVTPLPALAITTDSDLRGSVGKEFAAHFKASGGDGNYEIQGGGEAPGLSWTQTYCPNGQVCAQMVSPDTITLYGTPNKAGKFDVKVTAKDKQEIQCITTPCEGQVVNYGRAAFTVVISGENGAGAPVVKGIKGPTKVKTGHDNTWVVHATDPANGNLSYNITWGDEAADAALGVSAPRNSEKAFVQTATFSHTYRAAGEYAITVRVVNDAGKEAKTSLTVNVAENESQLQVYTNAKLTAQVGTYFSARFFAKGGSAPYAMSVSAGSLPPGLSLIQRAPLLYPCDPLPDDPKACERMQVLETAQLAGTPTTPGYYKFTLAAAGSDGIRGSATFYMKVYAVDEMPVAVKSANPASGPVGTQVTLYGRGFSATGNTIHFGEGVIVNVPSSDGASLVFSVPASLDPACLFSNPACRVASRMTTPGKYDVRLTNGRGEKSNAIVFEVTGTSPY